MMSERTFLCRIVTVPATSLLEIPGSKISCDDDVYKGSMVSSALRPIVYYTGSLANIDDDTTVLAKRYR